MQNPPLVPRPPLGPSCFTVIGDAAPEGGGHAAGGGGRRRTTKRGRWAVDDACAAGDADAPTAPNGPPWGGARRGRSPADAAPAAGGRGWAASPPLDPCPSAASRRLGGGRPRARPGAAAPPADEAARLEATWPWAAPGADLAARSPSWMSEADLLTLDDPGQLSFEELMATPIAAAPAPPAAPAAAPAFALPGAVGPLLWPLTFVAAAHAADEAHRAAGAAPVLPPAQQPVWLLPDGGVAAGPRAQRLPESALAALGQPLALAAWRGDLLAVVDLLVAGADAGGADPATGLTPLHWAALRRDDMAAREVARLLLEAAPEGRHADTAAGLRPWELAARHLGGGSRLAAQLRPPQADVR